MLGDCYIEIHIRINLISRNYKASKLIRNDPETLVNVASDEILDALRIKLILHLSYVKVFKYIDWLQSRKFLETQKITILQPINMLQKFVV